MIGIVFEGCACRAAFHAGVAASLLEEGLPLRWSAGSSSGAIVAAAVAAGKATELPRFFQALGGRSVVSLRRVCWNRSIFDMSHIVRHALRDSLGALDLRDRPIEACVAATRLPDLRTLYYSSLQEADLLEPLLGSCFFPPLYGRWVRVRGDWLVDGGLRNNLPVEPLVARGATEIIAVVARHDGTAMKRPLSPRISPAGGVAARVHVVHPRAPLAIGSWDFDAARMAQAIDEGRRQGDALLARRAHEDA